MNFGQKLRHSHLDKHHYVFLHEVFKRGPRVARNDIPGEVSIPSPSGALLNHVGERFHAVRLGRHNCSEVPAEALVQHVLGVKIHRVTTRQHDRLVVAQEVREALELRIEAPLHLLPADQERVLKDALDGRGQGRVGPADGAGLFGPLDGMPRQVLHVTVHIAYAGEVARANAAPPGTLDDCFGFEAPVLLGREVRSARRKAKTAQKGFVCAKVR